MLVVNWSDRLDAGFLRLKKNTTLSFPTDSPEKSKLSHLYEWEKQIIFQPAGKTISEPWGFSADRVISDDNFWRPEQLTQSNHE